MINVVLQSDRICITNGSTREEVERNWNANWNLSFNIFAGEDNWLANINCYGMHPRPKYYIATSQQRPNGDRIIVPYEGVDETYPELRFLESAGLKKIVEEFLAQIQGGQNE